LLSGICLPHRYDPALVVAAWRPHQHHHTLAQITDRQVTLLVIVISGVLVGLDRIGEHLHGVLEIEFPVGERPFSPSVEALFRQFMPKHQFKRQDER
jgi:hypothetical protein